MNTTDRPTMTELVAAVKRHAEDNYSRNGWDYIVECFSDTELADLIGPKCRTEKGAIRKVAHGAGISMLKERRDEVQSFIF